MARVRREIAVWRWRRERDRLGIPVTGPRRRSSGHAYAFESRRLGSDGG
jgi:hypothetical protein